MGGTYLSLNVGISLHSLQPYLMVAASEMCVITLAGAVTFPGHAGVPDTIVEVIKLLLDLEASVL
mgnify:CR=1 FL=1